MERSREARRGSMAALNGGLSRRRQRTGGLRDSPGLDEHLDLGEWRDGDGGDDEVAGAGGEERARSGSRAGSGEGEIGPEQEDERGEDDAPRQQQGRRGLATISIADLRSLAASRLDSMKRELDLRHSAIIKEFDRPLLLRRPPPGLLRVAACALGEACEIFKIRELFALNPRK